ncbi:hypothetical protein KP509_29G018600 [Ceratopteris richardii]|uniref:Uncharacterized protein n=1 Tax=Ceratopteris richardii TaxID=49495 RepID=A0A8T2R653_CERRI|nr:hypothetical protein KP509_29G018600 [Ceratopteris richardii]
MNVLCNHHVAELVLCLLFLMKNCGTILKRCSITTCAKLTQQVRRLKSN